MAARLPYALMQNSDTTQHYLYMQNQMGLARARRPLAPPPPHSSV